MASRILVLPSLAAALVAALVGAGEPGASSEPQPDHAALGGPATAWDSGPDAFSFPASVLDRIERRAFAVGNAFFKQNWVTAPSSTEGRDGLGPLFVARSCSTCHLRDGRGRPPHEPSPDSTGLLFRIGIAAGSERRPHPDYGEQLQDRSVSGVEPEAQVRIRTSSIQGRYADGTPYSLEKPVYVIESGAYGPVGGVTLSPRVATQLVGLGLLEAITETSIRARSDPDDRDGDGISGRPNQVLNQRTGKLELGRFGWKANQPTVEQQVAKAFQQDLGITSSLFPREPLTPPQLSSVAYVSGGSPEIDDHILERIAFYCRVLGVPAQRAPDDPEVRRGDALFGAIGCAGCHLPTVTTGEHPAFPAYGNARIRPYTDLLLHDLGPGLADGMPDHEASPAEWRTPPLWGIGLFSTVNGHTRYLHDGRARNLAEAILWHGGEATAARVAFERLPAADRAAVIAFLSSL